MSEVALPKSNRVIKVKIKVQRGEHPNILPLQLHDQASTAWFSRSFEYRFVRSTDVLQATQMKSKSDLFAIKLYSQGIDLV
jgi:hypothetical protein